MISECLFMSSKHSRTSTDIQPYMIFEIGPELSKNAATIIHETAAILWGNSLSVYIL